MDQAKLKFPNAFQAWKGNDKRRRYLLKAKELRLVERYEAQIPWGPMSRRKELPVSKQSHRQFVRAAAAALVLG